jgi:hypothetical protein
LTDPALVACGKGRFESGTRKALIVLKTVSTLLEEVALGNPKVKPALDVLLFKALARVLGPLSWCPQEELLPYLEVITALPGVLLQHLEGGSEALVVKQRHQINSDLGAIFSKFQNHRDRALAHCRVRIVRFPPCSW